jgi:hypothetical protein
MHNFEQFDLGDMAVCTGVIRRAGGRCKTIPELAKSIVDYFYEELIDDGDVTQKACALVRFFCTQDYDQLDEELKECADKLLTDAQRTSKMKCLVNVATRGDLPAWNDPRLSRNHRVIPLPSEAIVLEMPMIAKLIVDMGMNINKVLVPHGEIMIGKSEKDYNIFHIANAVGSEFIPAQNEFVIPHKIKSVIGFGGTTNAGNMFAVILFSKVRLSTEIANSFRNLALATNLAIMKMHEKNM